MVGEEKHKGLARLDKKSGGDYDQEEAKDGLVACLTPGQTARWWVSLLVQWAWKILKNNLRTND